MKKATGWDARDTRFQWHRALVNELDETGEGGLVHYRWECTCRRNGRWASSVTQAEKGARAHEQRMRPKPSGPASVQKLLSLG